MTIPPRAQQRRIKGFKIVPGGVCCTRPGPLGNPFPLVEGESRQDCVDSFERWARRLFKNRVPTNDCERAFLDAWPRVKAATKLYCFCRIDQPCHVDVIRKLLKEGY